MSLAAGFLLFFVGVLLLTGRCFFAADVRKNCLSRQFLCLCLVFVIFPTVSGFVSAQDLDEDFEFVDTPDYGFSGGEDEFEFIDGPEFASGKTDFGTAEGESDAVSGELPAEEEPIDLSVIPEPDVLLKVADELYFPRVDFSETFWRTQGYLNEVLEGDLIHQGCVRSGRGSDLLMSMFPAERSMMTSNIRLDMKRDLEKDYHASIIMLRGEDIPAGSGGCWLRYTNVKVKGNGSESGLILFPERGAYAVTPVGNLEDLEYTFVADLSGLDLHNAIKFDFIRLDGVSYIYANETFLFSYDDGYDGRMSFEGGAELYEGGNRVRCDFDNFTMRYR